MKAKLFKILLITFIFAAFFYFIEKNLAAIEDTYKTTTSNLTGYIFAGLILSFVCEAVITKVYVRIFSQVGIIRKFWNMMSLHLAATTVTVLVPSLGFSGAVIYAEDTKKSESRAAAITGFLLAGLADYAAIAFLVVAAMIYMATVGGLSLGVSIPALIFLLLALFLYILLWLSFRQSDSVRKIITKIFNWASKISEKFSKNKVNVSDSVNKFLSEFGAASRYIFENKKSWLLTISLMLFSHFIRLVVLYLIFISVGYEPTYRVLLSGYAVGTLFVIISPTPSGIGFVEGAMVLAYTNLGVPGAIATTASLIYRGLVFWIPFMIGFVIMQGSRIKRVRAETLKLDT